MRRIDPVRLSVPVTARNAPATHRGPVGSLGDSQAFNQLGSPTNGNLLTQRNVVRQTFSLNKVERSSDTNKKGDNIFNTINNDSFTTNDHL